MSALPPAVVARYGNGMPLLDSPTWIFEVRTQAKLTQEQFAARVRVARETVTNWEGGKFEPDFQNMRQILAEFPGAGELLVGGAASIEPSLLPKSIEAREMAFRVDRLPKEMRAYLRDMVYRVLGEKKGKPPIS